MKIIFLDIDGVLNFNGCRERIDTIYFVNDKKLRLLKWIVGRTNARLVLSSTWRLGWFDRDKGLENEEVLIFNRLEEKFKEYGLSFLSKTPVAESGCRGHEIRAWLYGWEGEPIESFVILDDNCDMEPYKGHLVQTSFWHGLRIRDALRAVRMLAS